MLRLTRSALLLVALASTVGILTACAGGKPIDVDGGGDDDDDGATLTTNLSALITGPWTTETCNTSIGCHQGTAPAGVLLLGGGGVTATDVFNSIHSRPGVLNTANVAASLLLTDPAGTTAHTGGTVWATTDETYQGTMRWIEQGAQNN